MRSGAVAKALPHLQVVEATDGTTLTPATDDRFSVLARVNLMRGTRRSHTDLVTLGMAGLYVSHVEVWKKVIASGAELALVLEDDAEITLDTLPRMNDVLRQLPPPTEWDVWIVGCLTVDAHGPAPGLDPAIHEVREYYGTQAYVISRRGAQRLLALAYPMAVQIDAFMAQASLLGLIRTLWRADNHVHVKQLLFAGTTVQQTYCDLCDLPHDYNRFTDVGKWLAVGIAIGLAWYRMPRDWVSRVPLVGRWCSRHTKAVAAASKRRRAAAS